MEQTAEARAAHWLAEWGLARDGAAVATGAALLWPVTRGGRALMLKLGDPQGDEGGAAGFLRALDGRGAVRVDQVAEGGAVVLMERVSGGESLAEMALAGQDEAAMAVLCGLAGQVQQALKGQAVPGLAPLDLRMRALWQADFPLAIWARDMVAPMLGRREDWRPLHGDLHHFNALHDSGRGWLLIDPKALLGPPAYDLANAVLNPFPHAGLVLTPDRMTLMAGQAAAHLGISLQDMLRWVCLHGCLATAWDGGAGYWADGARMAGRLAGLSPP